MMQGLDLLQRYVKIAVISNNIIRDFQSFVTARLRREYTTCLTFGFVVTSHQTPYLGFFIAVDDQNPIDKVSNWGLSEQGYSDDLVTAACAGRSLISHSLDAGVHDRLQARFRIRVSKYDSSHGAAVQISLVIKNAVAKFMPDIVQRGFSRCNDLSRNQVGVDDGYVECHKHVGDRRFTTGDASCKADSHRR